MVSSDVEMLRLGFEIVQFIMTGLVAFYVYISNKDKVTNDKIDTLEEDLDKKLDGYGERISKLEAGPSKGDISELHKKVNDVSNGVAALRGEFSATSRTLQLIHETLMERGK